MNSDAFSLVIWTVGREPKEVPIRRGTPQGHRVGPETQRRQRPSVQFGDGLAVPPVGVGTMRWCPVLRRRIWVGQAIVGFSQYVRMAARTTALPLAGTETLFYKNLAACN